MASTEHLRALDKQHIWHPFTQMRDWCHPDHDPVVLVSGEGVYLTDSEGNRYIDGNSSIWTNIHGHRHPHLDEAIKKQVDQIAHCSALGFTNEPAILLAEKLCSFFPEKTLNRVFYTDDGSTALECACKMAIQYRQLTNQPDRNRFISFDLAYHGDTAGAGSLGGIHGFKKRFEGTGFDSVTVPDIETLIQLPELELRTVTAVCIEPLVQGAAGMQLWPAGMLRKLKRWCEKNDILLILDEVMTGFGRTGKMFACQHEDVIPDFLCLAKGLTGGYLPLAATLTTDKVYNAFLGGYSETFFHGHSYYGNPIGCAAALANLEIFEAEKVLEHLPQKINRLEELLGHHFYRAKNVKQVRQLGLIVGIDIGPFDHDTKMGAKTCLAARKYGLLTRPILDTLVLMPPLCITEPELEKMVEALALALGDTTGQSQCPNRV